mmetsp:Transcript_19524/g.28655  ORF Transcript_19524/g.28655 Transcript_19524/m.28655 type:complete len:85 (-) Transcript_19524:43-297(-)
MKLQFFGFGGLFATSPGAAVAEVAAAAAAECAAAAGTVPAAAGDDAAAAAVAAAVESKQQGPYFDELHRNRPLAPLHLPSAGQE